MLGSPQPEAEHSVAGTPVTSTDHLVSECRQPKGKGRHNCETLPPRWRGYIASRCGLVGGPPRTSSSAGLAIPRVPKVGLGRGLPWKRSAEGSQSMVSGRVSLVRSSRECIALNTTLLRRYRCWVIPHDRRRGRRGTWSCFLVGK